MIIMVLLTAIKVICSGGTTISADLFLRNFKSNVDLKTCFDRSKNIVVWVTCNLPKDLKDLNDGFFGMADVPMKLI